MAREFSTEECLIQHIQSAELNHVGSMQSQADGSSVQRFTVSSISSGTVYGRRDVVLMSSPWVDKASGSCIIGVLNWWRSEHR